MYNVNFEAVFSLPFNSLRINITPYGELFLSLLTEIKFEIWRATFFKSVLPLKYHGVDFWFSGNNGNIE